MHNLWKLNVPCDRHLNMCSLFSYLCAFTFHQLSRYISARMQYQISHWSSYMGYSFSKPFAQLYKLPIISCTQLWPIVENLLMTIVLVSQSAGIAGGHVRDWLHDYSSLFFSLLYQSTDVSWIILLDLGIILSFVMIWQCTRKLYLFNYNYV